MSSRRDKKIFAEKKHGFNGRYSEENLIFKLDFLCIRIHPRCYILIFCLNEALYRTQENRKLGRENSTCRTGYPVSCCDMDQLPREFATLYWEVEAGVSRRIPRSGIIQQLPKEFDVVWEDLAAGISDLVDTLNGTDGKIFGAKEFVRLYSMVFNMCPGYSQQLYDRYKMTLESYTEIVVLPSLKAKHGEFLLKELVVVWKNHKVMVRWLSKIFQRLDSYYVQPNLLLPLGELGVSCFHDMVFDDLKTTVSTTVIAMVNKDRDGEIIDRSLVKDVLDMYIEIGRQSLGLYKLYFEHSLCKSTAEYYSKKSQTWMLEYSSGLEYIFKAEECLQIEKEQVVNYLHSSTEPRLLEVTLREISKHAEQILNNEDSCRALLKDGKHEELSRLYSFFSKTEDGLFMISKIFEKHLNEEVLSLLKDASANNKQDFVHKAIKLHDYELKFVTNCFQNNTASYKAHREAFKVLWNKNIAGCSCAELLATFCDNILRNGGNEKLSDDAVEETFEKVTGMLLYMSDRDLFVEFYRIKLARRLLNFKSVNIDHERSFLRALHMCLDWGTVSTMECMVSDIENAGDHQTEFEAHMSSFPELKSNVTLNVTLVKEKIWPIYKSNINVPSELVKCVESFAKYYASQKAYESRKLTWIYSLGTCNITGKFEAKDIELIVTTYQAALLLLFNVADRISYLDIWKQLNLPDADTMSLLYSLSCGKCKILYKEPDNGKIAPSDVFYFNQKFTHKLERIKVPLPSDHKDKVIGAVVTDRRSAMEACIVRVMKFRKVMSHKQLIEECTNQLSRKFKPEVGAIKKRIESLVEREYLERDKKRFDIYRYIA